MNSTSKIISLKERRKRIIKLFRYLIFDIARENIERKVLGNKFVDKRATERNRRRAVRFVEAALEMGGVLIKLGQYLSARFDILPEVWLTELSRLQDAVPAVDFELLRPLIEQDFNGKLATLFQEFKTTPLASASLGQVHEAWLLDGTHVAVKIRRPGIELIIAADLEALNRVIDFVKRRTELGKLADLQAIAREFEKTLRTELDYTKEGQSAERFRTNFQKLKYVHIPQVYWERSSGRILTTEFIEGIKVNDYVRMDAAGLDRHKAARILANCYLNQFLIDGFFHADPHPGNIFVRNTATGLQVVFIDFGMVGEISNELRLQLRGLIFAILSRDVDAIVVSFRQLGFIRREEDVDKIRIGISYFLDKFIGYDLAHIKSMDKVKVFEDLSYLIYSQPLYIPGDFVFMSRATEVLVGICTGLSPDLNMAAEAKPFMERLAAEQLGSATVARTLFGLADTIKDVPGGATVLAFLNSPSGEQLRTNLLQLATLPRTLNQTLEKLESGRISVQFQSVEMRQASERLQKSNERLLSGVLASGFLVSGVVLATAATVPIWIAVIFLLGAGFCGLRLLIR